MKTIYAKSAEYGSVTLIDHTKMVLNMGCFLFKKNISNFDDSFFREMVASLILHDIGKCTTSFQKQLKKKIQSEEKEPCHNIISWAFAQSALNGIRPTGNNHYKHHAILSSILYHHTIKIDNSNKQKNLIPGDIINNLYENDKDSITDMINFYKEMAEYAKIYHGIDLLKDNDYGITDDVTEYVGDSALNEKLFTDIEYYKKGNGYYLDDNCKSLIIRGILTYSDRIISKGQYENKKILNNDIQYMNTICEANFQPLFPNYSNYDVERLRVQQEVINECESNTDINTNIICASAGFGKTLMGILSFLNNQQKTLWVLPTLSLCDSAYKSIIDELEMLEISNQVSVGLYYTNEFKEGNADCDIIVIGIDALLGRFNKNNMSLWLFDALSNNIIFDEYHEFLSKQPLFAAFINLVKVRKDYIHSNTIMLSATPLNFDNLWGKSNVRYWDNMPVQGSDININFHYIEEQSIIGRNLNCDENTIALFPTIDSSQQIYLNNLTEAELIHSRYTDNDKKEKFQKIYEIYGKKSTVSNKIPFIGTNIIGTGFNISAKNLIEYSINPMKTIQIIGRGGRFNEYSQINYTAITSEDKPINRLIKEMGFENINNAWNKEVLSALNNKIITKKKFYEIYNNFMNTHKDIWNDCITNNFNVSAMELSNIKYVNGYHKKKKEDKEKLGSGQTYRGKNDSFYATVKIKDNAYLDPIIVESNVKYWEDDDRHGSDIEDRKKRYDFMTSGIYPNFPSKKEMEYKWSIKSKADASAENCSKIAKSKDCPLLLLNFDYRKDIGLFKKELFD